jgi:pimeloyl-ACP methyl ester carboxylesterase
VNTASHPRCIVFSHANSFPAPTYRVLFEAWQQAGWRVLALEKIGHDERWPIASNWHRLRDQLIDFIVTQAPGQAVHLVGHSLGGYLSLLAASRRPALARSVVLLDSPVVTGWRAQGLRVAKASGLVRHVTPGRVSQRRRWQWPSSEDALRHFAAKSLFARWDERVLRDYIACGTEPDPGAAASGAVRLAFRREVETQLYNTVPDHLGTLLRRHPTGCPVGFIGGTQSFEVRQVGLAGTRALTQGRLRWVEGTHLFPMERPEASAAEVLALIEALASDRR